MISRWVSINCDDCGDAGPLAEDVPKARALAEAQGFERVVREHQSGQRVYADLCPTCRPRIYP